MARPLGGSAGFGGIVGHLMWRLHLQAPTPRVLPRDPHPTLTASREMTPHGGGGWPGQRPPQSPALLHWGASSASLVLFLLLTNGSMASFPEASFSLPNALQVPAGQAPVPVTEASQARACGGGGPKSTSQRSALCTGGQLRAPSQQLPTPNNGDRFSQRMGGFPPVQGRVQDGLTSSGLDRRNQRG